MGSPDDAQIHPMICVKFYKILLGIWYFYGHVLLRHPYPHQCWNPLRANALDKAQSTITDVGNFTYQHSSKRDNTRILIERIPLSKAKYFLFVSTFTKLSMWRMLSHSKKIFKSLKWNNDSFSKIITYCTISKNVHIYFSLCAFITI